MLSEQRVVLEQEAVSGIRIENELGVGQALRQDKRVHGRDDQIMAAAGDQHRVRYFSEPRVGRVLVAIPAGQGRSLSLHPRTREKRIALACSPLEPIPEGRPCRPARFARFKEELEQPIPGRGPRCRVKDRLVQVLAALAFARASPPQDEATHQLGVV